MPAAPPNKREDLIRRETAGATARSWPSEGIFHEAPCKSLPFQPRLPHPGEGPCLHREVACEGKRRRTLSKLRDADGIHLNSFQF
jgi:hypothetical protein